ncbi:MAG: fructose-bisphosphate aldolase [Candidatus Eremiobacteraeota bacterium]|nr:fructose-bisphosphate aldolase [Candidatus Eremiobacteraeota bacterium]
MTNVMNDELTAVARTLVAGGRGILTERCGALRGLVAGAPELERHVGGAVLDDEGLRQGFAAVLRGRGIVPGIEIGDEQTVLRERLAEYAVLGAGFARRRIRFDGPVATQARALARFAVACQAFGIVPLVEPVLPAAPDAVERALRRIVGELGDAGVAFDALVLATEMIAPRGSTLEEEDPARVVAATLRVLGATVPVAVAGIAFLADSPRATEHLCALNTTTPRRRPWPLTFTCGPALHRVRCNALAACGAYTAKAEQLLAA